MSKKKSSVGLGSLLTLLAAGAGLMYLYDPQQGGERRKVLRDKVSGLRVDAERLLEDRPEVRTLVEGAASQAKKLLKPDTIDDAALAERVKAHLSRHMSAPGSVAVNVKDGVVTLHGQVNAHEAQRIVRAASVLYGVKSIDNQLQVGSLTSS